MEKLKQHIFLVGFMGSGKSSIASGLAEGFGASVMEMDAQIVKEQGMSINDIFAQFGEERFRDIESELILSLEGKAPMVVSCGGGIVLRERNRDYMKKSGVVVYLSATPETIYERVKDGTDRPILNGNMNVEYIASLMEKRLPLYQGAADITIQTDGKSIEEICEEIKGALK